MYVSTQEDVVVIFIVIVVIGIREVDVCAWSGRQAIFVVPEDALPSRYVVECVASEAPHCPTLPAPLLCGAVRTGVAAAGGQPAGSRAGEDWSR